MNNLFGIKFELITPLQEQVAALGTCPKCRTNTARERHAAGGYVFLQCSNCLTVFVLDDCV